MFKVYSYIFYRITAFYQKNGFECEVVYAGKLMYLFHGINVATIFPFLHIELNYWLIIVVLALLSYWDVSFYSVDRYQNCCEKWKNESKTTKTIRGILVISYMILSIVLCRLAMDYYQGGFSYWKWKFLV